MNIEINSNQLSISVQFATFQRNGNIYIFILKQPMQYIGTEKQKQSNSIYENNNSNNKQIDKHKTHSYKVEIVKKIQKITSQEDKHRH